eukprot:scaffold36212_cov46-Phaeocystis_antarctica.AAC.2
MVHFFGASRRSSDHVVVARLHAPGRLGTSQLSNPRTQWVAPSARIADAAGACCLDDAVHERAHLPCSTSDASSVMHGRQASTWRPSAPRNQAAESGLRRIDVELAASLTSQPWSILSRGRLPDLG